MTAPATQAGRALAYGLRRLIPSASGDAVGRIVEAEQQAAAAAFAAARERVEALMTPSIGAARIGRNPYLDGYSKAIIAALAALTPKPEEARHGD